MGLGSIGRRHLRLARKLMPNADIRILRHLTANEVPKYSNGCFLSIKDALEFAPQIAVIASPAPFHIATAQALAEAGVHLLIEKPLSISLDSIPNLIQTCQKQGVFISMGYNLRFFKSLKHYKKLIDRGFIGKTLSVRCEVGHYLPSWRPGSDYTQGVSARRELGGGVLLELSHELDYLRWIFGEVEWVKATLSRQSDLAINVEDNAHITLGFLSKLGSHQLIASANLDFYRHDATRACIAIGEKGSLRWNGLTGVVDFYGEGSSDWQELFRHLEERDASYIEEWMSFIGSITGQNVLVSTGEDGQKVMEIIDAVRKSTLLGGVRCHLTT